MGRGTIKANFSREALRRFMDGRLERINDALIMELQTIGEKVVAHARDLRPPVSFVDQSGNLRASIGYVIYANGKPLVKDFVDHNGPKGNNGEGRRAGEDLAEQIGKEYPKGIVLVVVAGMNYASYVEANNRDVLTSAEHLAEKLVPEMIQALERDILNG